jgi:hypothetical protein
MIEKRARWAGCLAIAVFVLATASCRESGLDVKVTFLFSADIRYDRLRLLWLVADNQARVVAEKEFSETSGPSAQTAGVTLARGTIAKFRLLAILDNKVVAQGELTVIGGEIPKPGPMLVCATPVSAIGPEAHCEFLPPNKVLPDAGPDGAPDGSIDAGDDSADVHDADAHAGPDTWVPPACVTLSLDAGTQPLPSAPPFSTSACERYCSLMTQNCHRSYRSPEVCLLACAKLEWPEFGPGADSLECRIARATTATSSTSCQEAEVFPRGACGTSCAVYCHAGTRLCPSDFPDFGTCVGLCESAKAREMKTFPGRDFDDYVLLCRFGHIQEIVVDPGLCQLMAPNACVPECQHLIF